MDKSVIVSRKHPEEKETIAVAMRREMTFPEKLLWQKLRRNQLAGLHFRRQQVIDGFITDFYCHSAKLVVEVDGAVHTSQEEYDAERTRILIAHGLRVVRFSNDQIRRNMQGVLQQIAQQAKPQTS